ncbi:nucleoid-associated protein [Enterobacter ludwigii]|uniref:nucleoid-associated protein n=1 Tax=Enterobacter ludwigii TaxID=299767 RepID=UPI00129D1CB7|nr:nucleoid-associated protein [Enterobacter ludwigii]MRI47931.1 nucleoid-associated protein [Enterobacter ludwigii]
MTGIDFSFEGLTIERVIAHRIFPRSASKTMTPAKLSQQLLNFSGEAIDALQLRITEALAARSHGIEMSIREGVADSFLNLAASTMRTSDDIFIKVSQRLANKLTESQFNSGAPGGILIIVSGEVGEEQTPFLAVIKAETQTGFSTHENEEQLTMQFLNELLLTPSQRFYKIGFIVEKEAATKDENDNYPSSSFRAFLFDHLMTSTDTSKAASYFYNSFLGMDISSSSKKLTQDFYETTRKFINESSIPEEVKLDLHEALRAELRSKKTTLNINAFADEHFPDAIKDKYKKAISDKKLPQNSFIKDTDYISSKLKRRSRLIFSNDIWLSVPPENFRELVEILPSDDHNITLIKINGKLTSQL